MNTFWNRIFKVIINTRFYASMIHSSSTNMFVLAEFLRLSRALLSELFFCASPCANGEARMPCKSFELWGITSLCDVQWLLLEKIFLYKNERQPLKGSNMPWRSGASLLLPECFNWHNLKPLKPTRQQVDSMISCFAVWRDLGFFRVRVWVRVSYVLLLDWRGGKCIQRSSSKKWQEKPWSIV